MIKDGDVRPWLAGASVVLVVALLAMVGFGLMPAPLRDVGLIMVGGIMSRYGSIHDYYFGSSSGSKEKTALLGANSDGTQP